MPHHLSSHIGRLRAGRFSATTVIVGLTATLMVATSLMIFIGSYKVAQRNTVELTREKAESMVDRIVERARDHLSPVEAQVSFVAGLIEDSDVATTDFQSLGSTLLSALSATPQVSVLAYVSKDLRIVQAFRARPDETVRIDDWSGNERLASMMEQAATKEGPFWGGLFFAETLGETIVNLRIGVRRDDRFVGLLMAGVSLKELSLFSFLTFTARATPRASRRLSSFMMIRECWRIPCCSLIFLASAMKIHCQR